MTNPEASRGASFLQARRLARTSQTVAGAIVGVSRQAIGALERGERPPKVPELLNLSSLYRVRPELLLAGSSIVQAEQGNAVVNFRGGEDLPLDHHDRDEIRLVEQALAAWPRTASLPDVSANAVIPAQCEQVRREVEQPDLPFDPFRALDAHGVLLRFTTLVKIDGAIVRVPDQAKCAVIVNSDQPDDRMRWSATHELAHFVLRHSGFGREHIDLFGAPRTQDDKDADQFAGELLMPAQNLRDDLGALRPEDPLAEALYRLSDKYQVSYAALVVRLGNLDVLTPSAVEALRKERPTEIEAKLKLKEKRPSLFAPNEVMPAICSELVANGDLPVDWATDFVLGWRHLRALQSEAVLRYVRSVPSADRADSVNHVHQEVARWVAENFPCSW